MQMKKYWRSVDGIQVLIGNIIKGTIGSFLFIGITITGNLNVSIDSFFCFSMYLISAEFEILGNRLKAIQTKPQIGSIKLELVKHVKIYHDITEIIQEMKNNLALTYFTQLILSGIVVCSCTTGLAKVN